MAHYGLNRQAEHDIALEFGGDLCVTSDGSPVIRDEHGLWFEQGHYLADPPGFKSLNQRRDNVFGLCREWERLGHQGSPLRVVEPQCGTKFSNCRYVWFRLQLRPIWRRTS